MRAIIIDYIVTFGWAVVGTFSMGFALLVILKVFTMSTRGVDEWALVKEGNIPIAIILASLILGCSFVVGSLLRP